MLDGTLASLIPIFYVFTTGRRLFAMNQVLELAKAQVFDELVADAMTSIDHDMKTLKLEVQWDGRNTGSPIPPEMRQVDIDTDATMVRIRDILTNQVEDTEPGDPFATAGTDLLGNIYPQGVAAITSLSYVEQLAHVKRITEELDDPKWQPMLKEFGLVRLCERLKGLYAQYHSLMNMSQSPTVKFAEVKAARDRGQSLMLQAVVTILHKYKDDTKENTEARLSFLKPILDQNEAVRQYLKSRQPVADVNPETGVEVVKPDGQGVAIDPVAKPVAPVPGVSAAVPPATEKK